MIPSRVPGAYFPFDVNVTNLEPYVVGALVRESSAANPDPQVQYQVRSPCLFF